MLFAKASRRLIVTVEKIVPHSEIISKPNRTFIPHNWVEAVVEVPFGCHPAPCDAFYDEDEVHMAEYQALSKENRWDEYARSTSTAARITTNISTRRSRLRAWPASSFAKGGNDNGKIHGQ